MTWTEPHHAARLLAIATLLSLCAGCSACTAGCSERAVAVITVAESQVDRDRVAAIEQWVSASTEDAIHMGEAVRTGSDARAELRLVAGGGLRLGHSSLVRFGGERGETPSLAWGAGEIDVDADEDLIVTTEFGRIRLHGGSRLVGVYGQGGVRVEVVFGLAQLEDGTELTTGEVFDGRELTHDFAHAPELELEASHAPAAPEADALQEAHDDPTDGGAPIAEGVRVPSVTPYDFTVAGGSGGVVHHPAPPATVGIDTGCADGEVLVEAAGTPTTFVGGGTVGIRIPRGAARYEVRCGGVPRADGRFVVTSDSGRRRLNTRSQRHTIAADGRRYTFLYEGSVPTLTLRWNGAPPSEEYVVSLTGTRRVSRLTSSTPAVTLPRSALRDGDMTFRFTAGDRQSATTTVTLHYDQASPTATVDSPSDAGFGAGAVVTVAGMAQVGSRVAVGGQQLEVDSRGAFSGTAQAEAGGLAVRIATPNQGVHYFVRRSAGR